MNLLRIRDTLRSPVCRMASPDACYDRTILAFRGIIIAGGVSLALWGAIIYAVL
jgi:hypothetical protein